MSLDAMTRVMTDTLGAVLPALVFDEKYTEFQLTNLFINGVFKSTINPNICDQYNIKGELGAQVKNLNRLYAEPNNSMICVLSDSEVTAFRADMQKKYIQIKSTCLNQERVEQVDGPQIVSRAEPKQAEHTIGIPAAAVPVSNPDAFVVPNRTDEEFFRCLTYKRGKVVQNIVESGKLLTLLMDMPEVYESKGATIKQRMKYEPGEAAEDLLSVVKAKEAWEELITALSKIPDLKPSLDVFTGPIPVKK